jgi:hypothetical protein
MDNLIEANLNEAALRATTKLQRPPSGDSNTTP